MFDSVVRCLIRQPLSNDPVVRSGVIAPKGTIPRAIVVTWAITGLLYLAVAFVAIGALGAERFSQSPGAQVTPLEFAASAADAPLLVGLIAMGAITAILGVLLNLILGLSRVVLAMDRQGDLPPMFGHVSSSGSAPAAAVIAVGILAAGLASIGSVQTTRAFSAFTRSRLLRSHHIAALRLALEHRLYTRWIAVAGLAAYLCLAFWVAPAIWGTGLALIAASLLWKTTMPRIWRTRE